MNPINKPPLFDLNLPSYSYMIGFIQADGHLYKGKGNKGKLSIELSVKDKFILEVFQKLIPSYSSLNTRMRNTNFKKSYTSAVLEVCGKSLRDTVNYYGVPYGKKSSLIKPPEQTHSEVDYWRGIIDADGSVGVTRFGQPFISLITASESLYNAYRLFVSKFIGREIQHKRNRRDYVYNVLILNEDAQIIISTLYYTGCISIPRKFNKSRLALNWIRPSSNKKRIIPFVDWPKEDIDILVHNSVPDCLVLFKNVRSENSIRTKRSRERRKLSDKGVLIKKFKKTKYAHHREIYLNR